MPSDTGFRRQQNTCLVVFSAGRNHSQTFLIVLTLTISPGCFSLFRAKAVMDENVMHTYTTVASQPKHFVQYDQVADFKRQQQAYFFSLRARIGGCALFF